ncbi:AI-2E family transporter [Gracilibacillus alcaliphilus]|uniref:AI-2E family transporter n=1 Tax=Gracilibacillus alcaliphilus TaxID=1401441 RepID=UPI0019592044|nr:AI-2E family transporter [Gracilibacillus alcaliphilus]MBM7679672.1 putative PurR-regulated permease PerM [Gracilibacillus alcaliphilus]
MKDSNDKLINFLGGKNLFFVLGALILIGITVIVYNQISFIFVPIQIIFATLFPPVILAFVAYYLLNPVVNLLEKWRIKRVWGIILIILAFSGVVAGILIVTIPIIEQQIIELVSNFPGYVSTINDSIHQLMNNSIFENYYNEARDWIDENLGDLPATIMSQLGNTVEGIASFATTLTNIIVSLVTFPFVLFFLLKDGQRFKNYFLTLFPKRYRNDVTDILHRMDTQVGSYIQGQIFVAFCIGVLLYIGYLIIGLEYAIILAAVAAVTSVVPYLGPIIAITPAIIISIVTSPWMLLKLGVVWAVVQLLEGHLISPNVMGKTMKVHPLTIMFVLLVAGKLFGIFGVILGIPGYAVGKVIVTFAYRKFKGRYNKFYGEGYEDIQK